MAIALPHFLAPAWFDEARLIVQGEQFRDALAGHGLSGRVLNAGCGEGLYAPLIEQSAGVTAIVNVDVSRPSIAARRADRRHRDLRGSVTALPFVAAAFQSAMCSEVIEHVSDDRRAAAELARVLAPGGLLVVSVPAIPAPYDAAHAREGYTHDSLHSLLHGAGFDVLSVRECHHLFLRVLYRAWQWQQRVAGRNIFPRAALRLLAHVDRLTRLGRPWDLVVMARKKN
jgi:SAM-dependent methyltransferase